jgi:FkbH-like protein
LNFFDQRFWLISHMPFSSRGVEAIGDAVATTILHRLGRVRKALILDCDNTLWGGILDEVGLEGLDLSDYFPGNAFKAFQSDVLALKNQGILLGLCTRNDEENVRQVFESHPGMILKWNDIAVVRANWDDKADNLVQISQELNIGLSSLVFVDDSAHEIDRVSQMVPDVLCVKVDPARPAHHGDALRAVSLFDLSGPTTMVDRTAQAHEQRVRREWLENADSAADYQAALETVVTIREATDMDIGRICDMARRTNQFHATGIRHSIEEVADWIRRPHVRVRLAKLADRVGDLGDIGVAVIDVSEATAHIDAFLLSCRAIGRGVEWAMMTDALSEVGERALSASVTETGRNRLAVEFIQAAGGSDLEIPHDGSLATLQIDPDIVGQQMQSWILQLIHMSSGAD